MNPDESNQKKVVDFQEPPLPDRWPKTASRFKLKPGMALEVTTSPKVKSLDGVYFPFSKTWIRSVPWSGWMIQYSVTPDSSYTSYLFCSSLRLLPGERISTIRSGAPIHPSSSSLCGSQITQRSGCTTVSMSSFFRDLPGRRTSKGAGNTSQGLPCRKVNRAVAIFNETRWWFVRGAAANRYT